MFQKWCFLSCANGSWNRLVNNKTESKFQFASFVCWTWQLLGATNPGAGFLNFSKAYYLAY